MADVRLVSDRVRAGDAFEAMEIFMDRGWTDGLPVVPPTAATVERFLDAARLAPADVLGVERTKGAVVTGEKLAINAVMAGCKPEYMPVLVAAVQAMTAEEFSLHAITVSTMGAGILLIVNGPIARQLKINSGVNALGAGNRANATIGRAVRLLVLNVLGTRPGALDKATLGHPGKYAWCMAEAEDVSPWAPLHVARGHEPDASAVTVAAGLSGSQVGQHAANTPETLLDTFVDNLLGMGPSMQEVFLILCPEHLEHLRRARWSKAQVGEYLHAAARRSRSSWAARGRPVPGAGDEDEKVSALAAPESLITVIAGGAGGGWSQLIPTWSFGAKSRAVTRAVR